MVSFLMGFSVAHILPTCYIQGDTDNEGAFCREPKLRGLTRFQLDSVSLHLSSLIRSSELCVGYLVSGGSGISWETCLVQCLP